MDTTVKLAEELISRQSVTPEDGGCQKLLTERLEKIGFKAEQIDFEDVKNLWITHGEGQPVFAYLGHTDVVPTGPLEEWDSDPFTPEIRDGYLYGRGACDMKGSIACIVTALERFIPENPNHEGTIGVLLTSDEEGIAINGVKRVIETFEEHGTKIQWCLVGEPSSEKSIGDIIRPGRRGSLNAVLTIHGIQGHVAFPEKARNPIHQASQALTDLCNEQWDNGNDFFPPTGFQIVNLQAGTGAENIIPGALEVGFNFRFCTESTEEGLKQRVLEILDKHNLDYDIRWRLSGYPFLTEDGELLEAAKFAVKTITGNDSTLSTAGGTSDGRFVAPTGAEVIELGLVNETIHKINECVKVDDLITLSSIFETLLNKLFK